MKIGVNSEGVEKLLAHELCERKCPTIQNATTL